MCDLFYVCFISVLFVEPMVWMIPVWRMMFSFFLFLFSRFLFVFYGVERKHTVHWERTYMQRKHVSWNTEGHCILELFVYLLYLFLFVFICNADDDCLCL